MTDTPPENAARIQAEQVVARALEQSWDEGYGDCPHPECSGSECAPCDAHLAVDALLSGGWTMRPPCVECDARYPCRLTFADDEPGECALAAMGVTHARAT